MTTESSESTQVDSSATDTEGVDATTDVTSADANPQGAIASATEASATEASAAEDAEAIDPTDPQYMDRYECRACGYIYEPLKGDDSSGIDAGVPFKDIYESWKCPICTAPKRRFNNIGPAGNPSGFKENLGYGFGVNVMTPGQKNILIFGGLLLGFLFFISLYGLR